MPSLRRALLPVALALTAFSFSAWGATIDVPKDKPTIQAGIDAASDGDIVLVATGASAMVPAIYYENIDFKGKAITVTSTLSNDPGAIAAATASTIIDGGSIGPAVTFKTSEPRTAVLEYFTIQNGGNFGSDEQFPAGGIVVTNSSPSILYNIINRNNCWSIYATDAGPLLQGNTISATQDPVGDCSFGGGAAIYLSANLQNNLGPLQDGLPATVLGNVLEDNVESGIENAGGNGGAGIAVSGGSPIIEDNIIRNNASPGGSGGGINIQSGQDVVILQNLIYGNSAGCGGGAIAFQGNAGHSPFTVLVANNTIVDNTDVGPGGYGTCINIAQLYPDPDSFGSDSNPTEVFVNNIISGSTSDPAINCNQIDVDTEATQPIFDHNILHNAGGAFFGNFCIDTSAKYGNITKPPQFVDAATNDYRLVAGSPGIDAGNNSVLQSLQTMTGSAVTVDFQGNPRLQDATGQGYPIIDIGAYELAGRVDATATTVVLTSSAYSGPAGSNYTLTANLASALGVPTGTVDFYIDDARLLGTSAIVDGTATLVSAALTPGVHSLYAYYPAANSFTQATSVIIIVNIDLYTTSLTLTGSPNPSLLGQNVTFTLTASSADPSYIPTHATLTDTSNNNAVLATVTPNSSGIATYSTAALTSGEHIIYASYPGDATHAASNASDLQDVNNGVATTTTMLSSSANPANAGQSVTFTARVSSASGAPAGTVTFTDGNTTLDTVTLVNGIAIYLASNLAVGTHPITATFAPNGGATLIGSSDSLFQVIDQALYPTTTFIGASPNPSLAGQQVTFTVAITSPDPSFVPASVTLSAGGNSIAILTPDGSGFAKFTTSTLPGGYQFVYANYYGDSTHSASSAFTEQYVSNTAVTTTILTSSLDPAGLAQPVTLTATVTSAEGAPNGVETFQDSNGVLLGTQSLVNGVAAVTTNALAAGAHSITANYTPTGSVYTASEAILVQVVTGSAAATTTSLTVAPTGGVLGTTVQMNSAVASSGAAIAGGTISFMDGESILSTSDITAAAPAASFATSALAVGIHTITAVYSGDTAHSTSVSAPVTITITAPTTALNLKSSANPGFALQPFTVSAQVSSSSSLAPTGTVTFLLNGAVSRPVTVDSQGVALLSEDLPAGTYIVTASFAGTGDFAASTSAPLTEIVNPNPTTTTLTASPNPGVQNGTETLTATVAPFGSSSTDKVAFLDGATVLASVSIAPSGQASVPVGSLTPGTHTLTASYSGDPNFLASTSAPVILNLEQRDFTLAPDPGMQYPTITIKTEHHAYLLIALTSLGGFADTVNLRCTDLPQYASCNRTGPMPSLTAGANVMAAIDIDTDALLDYASSLHSPDRRRPGSPTYSSWLGRGIALALLLPVTLFAGCRRFNDRSYRLFAAVALFALTTFTGCSGRYPGHTPLGTYTLTLTGTGATTGIAHSAKVTLIVTE